VSVDLVDHAGRPAAMLRAGGTLIVRAHYRADRRVPSPIFQVAIVDVDTGLVITAATSARDDSPNAVVGDGMIECRFPRLPLRPRQYVLRLSITDSDQLASYDVVTAGPRFAISGGGHGIDGLADEEDGLVSLPYEFVHHGAVSAVPGPGL
jgi:ABC-2 type transport system ATP-binding protein